MSVTVSIAAPVLLFSSLQVLQSIVATGVAAASVSGITAKGIADTISKFKNVNSTETEYVHLKAEELEQILQKEFTTNIIDKDTLIKTLEEHGAVDIEVDNDSVTCTCEAFLLNFYKDEKNEPYKMIANFNNEYGLDKLVEDLGNEYALNAQEISYNKIKERLESKNLSISEEEIYEDNTIVLTIDLD